jgi:hypothetical protein
MIHKHVVSHLHVSAFFDHLQGGIQQGRCNNDRKRPKLVEDSPHVSIILSNCSAVVRLYMVTPVIRPHRT